MNKKEQFIAAIQHNEGFIYKLAAAYTNTPEDKNDLVQEIIYQLWKSFDSFDKRSSISTWIYRVALNVAIYQLKQFKRQPTITPIDNSLLNYHEPAQPNQEENWRILKQQIDQLNLLDKGIILLYLDNNSYERIAEIIGISVTNVGTKLMRIKEKLRQQNKHS